MYDPFKSARSKVVRRARKKTASAFVDLFGNMFAPPKPGRKNSVKAPKPAVKTARKAKPPAKPRTVAGEPAKRPGSVSGADIPMTSRSSTTTPRGASFRSGLHECEFGTRAFMLYIPAFAKTAASPLPLIVMLHGCRQTPLDFARGTGMNVLAEEFGFMVVYPAQDRGAQVHGCWNWYRRGDQARGAGEPALIADLSLRIIEEEGADPARVYIAGLSAGASTALIVAEAYPDIFAAVGAHSGLSVGAAHDKRSATIAMLQGAPGLRHSVHMPTINFHGDSDKVVNPRNGRFVASRALDPYENLRRTEKRGQVKSGRKYSRTSHRIGQGRSFTEHWVIIDAGHAWSGGNPAGSYTDPSGPDASREMVRFFLRHRTTVRRRSTIPA